MIKNSDKKIGDLRIRDVSPIIYRRFLRALYRAAKKRYHLDAVIGAGKAEKPAGITAGKSEPFSQKDFDRGYSAPANIPSNIYSFQKNAMRIKLPRMLKAEEINALQDKIKNMIEKEEYIAEIQRKERHAIKKISKKFERLEKEIEQKIEGVKQSQEEQRQRDIMLAEKEESLKQALLNGMEKVRKGMRKKGRLPEQKEKKNPYVRILGNIENKIKTIETQHKKLLRRKDIDKKQLQRYETMINQYRNRLERLKNKYLNRVNSEIK